MRTCSRTSQPVRVPSRPSPGESGRIPVGAAKGKYRGPPKKRAQHRARKARAGGGEAATVTGSPFARPKPSDAGAPRSPGCRIPPQRPRCVRTRTRTRTRTRPFFASSEPQHRPQNDRRLAQLRGTPPVLRADQVLVVVAVQLLPERVHHGDVEWQAAQRQRGAQHGRMLHDRRERDEDRVIGHGVAAVGIAAPQRRVAQAPLHARLGHPRVLPAQGGMGT